MNQRSLLVNRGRWSVHLIEEMKIELNDDNSCSDILVNDGYSLLLFFVGLSFRTCVCMPCLSEKQKNNN